MKLSTLLSKRPALLRQLRLAHLAFAYHTLCEFVARAARAQLHGIATLKHAAPDEDRYGATLTCSGSSPSVIEEHFTDRDLIDLADVLAFVTAQPGNESFELTFAIEDVPELFLAPVRAELEQSGVAIDCAAEPMEEHR